MKKIIIIQFIVLLIGTVFAWFNFFSEFVSWLAKRACTTGCSVGLANPFLTPCFYGAIFFAIAFVSSAVLLNKVQK